VEGFLASMGLQLSASKTRVSHTLQPHEGQVGFDFLGFTVRQCRVGKTHSGKNRYGVPLGYKTLIQPSKTAIKGHLAQLGTIVHRHRAAPPAALITALNRVILGWTRYYRAVVASATFAACDHHLFAQLRQWARFRHPNKGTGWVIHRYWQTHPHWHFMVKTGACAGLGLRNHTDTHQQQHVKIRGHASVYDGNLLYWATRLKDHPLTGNTLGRLLAWQKGRCPRCGLYFKDGDLLELDHLVPLAKGGSDDLTNKQALHRHCHDQKHSQQAVGYA
jgi:RNA-directed DNA polymerase